MSERVSPEAVADDPQTIETGLEAFQSSPEFRGPVEPLHSDEHAHANNHFALIYESQDKQFAAAIPFIRHGLERDERCLYVIDENSKEDVLDAMRAHGIDVDTALESGSLSVHTKQETHLRNGTFDPDEMIAFLGDAIDEAQEEYNGLRTAAEMGWIVDAEAEIDAFIEYEAKVNRLLSDEDCISLCQYNRERFSADVIRDVINTHPLLVHNGRVSHNVYYTPPEEFFGPDKAEREVDRQLGLLKEQTDAKAELHKRERFLREGYQITADPDLEFEEKLHRLLDLARDRMGLDAAGLTRLPEWDGPFRTEYALGYGDGDGTVDASDDVWTDPGEGYYCRQAITANEPVGMADVRGTDWEDDPIHREHGLSSYLGTRVTIGSRPYGTLWVGGTEPRDREFSETDRTFLELIGQWVSNELERREHTDAQRALYEVAADPDRGFDEKLDALFDLGRDRFGLDIGGMAEVYPDEDRLEVEYVSEEYGEFELGLEPPLSGTYCGAAYDADGAVTITDPVAEGYADGYAYQELGFRAYLGTHIEVDGERDRLFFFTTTEPRDAGFSNAEETFLELLGQWVKHELERHQRERELRERTEHLYALVEATPECIKTVAADGTLLQMNDAGLEMVEAPSEPAVTGDNVYDLIAPEDRDRFREFNERICRGENGTLEFDIIGLEGTRRHMESHAVPLDRPDGETVQVALTRDISEQKERERQLEESERRYRTLVENFPNGAVTLVDENLRYQTVGGDPHDVADVTAAEIEGRPVREALPSELADELVPRYEAALKDGEASAFEATYNGSIFEFHVVPVRDDDGDVFAALGMSQDVTNRIENKRKLAESERRYRTLVENFPNGSVALFDETYTYTAAGGALLDDLGHDPDDVVGTKIYDRYPEVVLDQLEPHFRAVFDGDANRFEVDLGDRDLVAYTLPVRNADDEIDAGMLVVQDVTERKESEQRLQEQNERLESFASMLAHELRNPVTIGQIYTKQLPADGDAEAVDYIAEAFDRIEDMIDVMLILTRGQEAVDERTPVALSEVTREAWTDVDAPEAVIDIATDQIVQADETYIRHLFRNLFENAVEHGSADVTVEVGELPDGDGFYVADDGPGIPVEKRDRVFDEGFTTAGDNGGIGLGLAFVQKVAEVYEWDLSVTESESSGARFEFRNVT
jgi:PAS domain S-box-containing protein